MNPKKNDNSNTPALVNYLSLKDVYLPPSLNKDDLIEVLNLPAKLENSLKFGGGIMTVGQLCDFPDKELLKIRNVGGRSVNYLVELRKRISEKFGILTEGNSIQESEEPQPEEINIPENELVTSLLERCGNDKAREVIIRRYG